MLVLANYTNYTSVCEHAFIKHCKSDVIVCC